MKVTIKLFVICFICLVIPFIAVDSAVAIDDPLLAWVVRQDLSDDLATDVAVDASGNVYVTGTYQTADAGTLGGNDVVVLKYGSSGNLLWQRFFNLPMEAGSRIKLDSADNVYVAGTHYKADPPAGREPYLVKYDPSGNKLWEAYHPIIEPGWLVDLEVDEEGNAYILCDDVTTGLFKYNSAGVQQWETFVLGTRPNDLEVDNGGNIFVTGAILYSLSEGNSIVTRKYAGLNGDELWEEITYINDEIDIGFTLSVDSTGDVYVAGMSWSNNAVLKYDGFSGDLEWTARYAGPEWDEARASAVDGNNNLFVAGNSKDSTGLFYDCLTVKYDDIGNRLWEARYDGPSNNEDLCGRGSLVLDSSGNAYVLSASKGGVPLRHDFAIISYDPNGFEKWVTRYDGPAHGSDYSSKITIDAAGNLYVTGSSWNGIDDDIVTVKYVERTPVNAINILSDFIEGASLNVGIERSLDAQLGNALKLISKGQVNAAVNILQALINHVLDLKGYELDDDQADTIIQKVQEIIDLILSL